MTMHVALYDLEWEGHNSPYAKLLSRFLLEAGHTVTFYTAPNNPKTDEFLDHNRFTVRFVPNPSIFGWRPSFVLIRKLIQAYQLRWARCSAYEDGADIFHHLCVDYEQFALWLATLGRPDPKIVVSLHRDHFNFDNTSGFWSRFDGLNRWSVERCLVEQRVSRVIVHAEAIAERLRSAVPATTETTLTTHPCPTPDMPSERNAKAARRNLDLPTDKPLFLFFGEMRHEKGPDILLDAVQDFDRPISVVFAGPAAEFDSSDISSFHRSDTGDAVVIDRIHYVPDEDLDDYFAAADVLVVPYRRPEAISGPLRRACLTNTHIIGSDDSDIGTIIERNNLGQTFERANFAALRDALMFYLRNEDAYPTDDVEPFGHSRHWKRAGCEIESTYYEILENQE